MNNYMKHLLVLLLFVSISAHATCHKHHVKSNHTVVPMQPLSGYCFHPHPLVDMVGNVHKQPKNDVCTPKS